MIIGVARGKGGTGKITSAANCDLKSYRVWGYLPFRRVFTQAQVEGKAILEYDYDEQIKLVLVGLWEKLRQELQKQKPS